MIQARSATPTADSPRPQVEILPRARTIRFAATLAMPIQLQGSIAIADRKSQSVARGTLDGAVVLAGLRAVLSFSCGAGMRKRGEASVATDVALIPAGDWFVIKGSDFHAPVAAGSPLQIQFRDSGPNPLTDVLSLGKIGAPLNFCASFRVPVAVVAEISTDDRSFNTGSEATIAGKLVFPRGILARCTFRLADDGSEDGQLMVGSEDTIAVVAGQEIRFAKRLVLSPSPARPLHSIAFLDGHGYRFAANGAASTQAPPGTLHYEGPPN